ncbi:Exportin-6 [Podila epigama]|nr:Exportin-6 [Podila epigama]
METLELLLAEFFGHSTSMDRKRIIEAQLESQRLSLDDCQYLLTHARSDYAAWFATSQFQKRIQSEWTHLDPQRQFAYRTFLLQFLQQRFGSGTNNNANGLSNGSRLAAPALTINGNSPLLSSSSGSGSGTGTDTNTGNGTPVDLSSFVANKVIQLVADIALLDWPDRYQDLFPDIHQLCQSSNQDHALLGWTLMEAIIQEFVGTYPAPGVGRSYRVHLTLAKQRRHVWENFKLQVPALLNLINHHLDTSYTKTLIAPLSTDAPAPSPVEHSPWAAANLGHMGRRPSFANAQSGSSFTLANSTFQNSFSGVRAVPGSMANSFASIGQTSFTGQSDQNPSATNSFGKSPTTMLRKTLTSFLGNPSTTTDQNHLAHPVQSPVGGSGFSLLQSRQRMGSISSIGQMAMRRNSINAAAAFMEGRRGSVEATFVTGSKMDSHTRKTCLLALKALTTLLSCPGLDPRQVSFSASLATVLRFSTLHQAKTVDLGILALSCLNGLVARPGFLASNQEVMTSSVRLMADLIRYFNEVRDGIDDIDESYLQMFMHFITLFCTLVHLERAERELGLSISDFLFSFAKFTLEKISVDYLKVCMDIWKSLLDIIIHSAADVPRPIPAHHRLRRIQAPILYFMSSLVDKFYKMKGATRSEEAFSTFEVEDEEDLDDLTELVEGFVGQVGEVYTEEVIEMLNPLLHQQLGLFSRREFDDCKTLPVTLGILSRVAYNLVQNFDLSREYTSNLMIHLIRMTKISIELYLSTAGDACTTGKGETSGAITLALLNALLPLIPWVHQMWKFESELASSHSPETEPQHRIARDIYQELAQNSSHLFRHLLPSTIFNAPANSLQSTFSGLNSSALGAFLGPASTSCSAMDRKLLVAAIKVLSGLTLQVRIPANISASSSLFFWELESTQMVAACLGQSVMACSEFMGLDFLPSTGATANKAIANDADDGHDGVTPTDDLYCNAYVALCNGIILDVRTGQEQAVLQAFGNLLAPLLYPLQKILQDARSAQGAYFSNPEVKFSVHRSLTTLRAIVLSLSELSTVSRTVAFEGLNSLLPLVQEYFDIYKDDHDLSMDVLRFFKALVTSLYKQVGNGYCLSIARVLMDRFSTPPVLETAFAPISQNGLNHGGNNLNGAHSHLQHQKSIVIRQQKLRDQVYESVQILKTILEIPGKEIAQSLPECIRFLFGELGPKLMQVSVTSQQKAGSPNSSSPVEASSYKAHQSSSKGEDGSEDGAFELMVLFFSTIQTLLTHHARYFFADTRVQAQRSPLASANNGSGDASVAASTSVAAVDRRPALQSCLEFLARGLHRPEPDVVSKVIEVLESLQDHLQCRLFDRPEFRQGFRYEFLQIVLRLALTHQHDLLLEEMAGLVHKLVRGERGTSGDEGFVRVWQSDLKQFVLNLEPIHVLTGQDRTKEMDEFVSSPHTQGGSNVNGIPKALVGVPFPDSTKEVLWMDMQRLGDEGSYREGLYDFINDAQVYAQTIAKPYL